MKEQIMYAVVTFHIAVVDLLICWLNAFDEWLRELQFTIEKEME